MASADIQSRPSITGPSAGRVERRLGLPSGRAVVGGLLMALAAIGTFLAYTGAETDAGIDVLVATRALSPGQTIEAGDVEMVSVVLPDGVRGLFGAVDAAVGRDVLAPIGAGEFIQASATVPARDGEEALEVAIALPVQRAVGGLRAGERVDVFSTWTSDVTELIAVDARVLEVGGSSDDLLSGEQVVVRLGVHDFEQIEALVHAQAAGDITMVRAALGTDLADLGRRYRPLTSSAAEPRA